MCGDFERAFYMFRKDLDKLEKLGNFVKTSKNVFI